MLAVDGSLGVSVAHSAEINAGSRSGRAWGTGVAPLIAVGGRWEPAPLATVFTQVRYQFVFYVGDDVLQQAHQVDATLGWEGTFVSSGGTAHGPKLGAGVVRSIGLESGSYRRSWGWLVDVQYRVRTSPDLEFLGGVGVTALEDGSYWTATIAMRKTFATW